MDNRVTFAPTYPPLHGNLSHRLLKHAPELHLIGFISGAFGRDHD